MAIIIFSYPITYNGETTVAHVYSLRKEHYLGTYFICNVYKNLFLKILCVD